MNFAKLLLCAAAGLCLQSPLVSLAALSEQEMHAKVVDLISRMTLEEKVGQLVQYSSPNEVTGPAEAANIDRELRAGRVGSMLNIIGSQRTRAMQEVAVKQTRLGIPLLFGYDVIHGYRTLFPINLGQAASWDLAAMEKAERISATEAAAAGIHWTFAPMVDISRDPRWGRIAEGSGEDTYLGSAIAKARVHGFQGNDLSKPDTVLACAKHFAAYGAAQAGRDYSTTDLSLGTLRDVYLPPFKAALDAGVATFMSGFNDLNGIPATANPYLLDHILRREWGFAGFVVSDWASIKELQAHGIAANAREAALAAFNAGVDMDMEGRAYMPNLPELVLDSKVNTQNINDSVYRILMAKARLGLFEDPYRYCNGTREETSMLTKENLEAARDLARKSCVLLQNEKGALPLHKGIRVALIGALADSNQDALGAWHAQGRAEEAVSLKQAFEKANLGELLYAQGCEVSGTDRSGFAEAIKVAKRSTAVVVVLGETAAMSGEASSRSELGFPGVQLDLLKELRAATKKPIILVVMAGRPLILAEARKYADAILYAWQLGTMGGPALVDLLSGAVSPSGKLPVSFPRSVGQIPIYYNHKSSGRPQADDAPTQKFRSNYLDVPNTPEFPFGFGLSYSQFEYSNIALSTASIGNNDPLRVAVTVTNKGRRTASEVVQLYVHDKVGVVTRPVRELRGFARVEIPAGQARVITFTLRAHDLAFTLPDLSFAPEPGQFEVFVGGDSNAPKVGEFEYQAR